MHSSRAEVKAEAKPDICKAETSANGCGDSCGCSNFPTSLSKKDEATKETEDQYKLAQNSLLLYIGPPSLRLSHLLMSNPSTPVSEISFRVLFYCLCLSQVIHYDPSIGQVVEPEQSTNKLLMRRYAAIQRARDADVFGILVGTLGVGEPSHHDSLPPFYTCARTARHLPLINQLRKILKAKQKKSYTLCVGKPTPSKLGNYQEIECFILVACPENSLLLTSSSVGKDFYRPNITPWEALVALEDGDWSDGWSLNWERLLSSSIESRHGEETVDGEEEDEGNLQFSSVTGQLRTVRKFDNDSLQEKMSDGALVSIPSGREVAQLMGSAAGEINLRLLEMSS